MNPNNDFCIASGTIAAGGDGRTRRVRPEK